MKKLITLITLSLAAVPAVLAETVPYSSNIGDNFAVSEGWKAVSTTKPWEYDRYSNFTTPRTNGGMMHPWDNETVNAMLISPGIELEEGKAYTVGFWVKTHENAPRDTENFKLLMGSEANINSLKNSTVLMDTVGYNNNTDFERIHRTFTASATATAYFGIYCYSNSWQGNICFTGFSIVEGTEDVLPDKPEAVKDMPFVADFSNGGGYSEWTPAKGPNAGDGSWRYNSYSKYPEFSSSDGGAEDDWFISPKLNIVIPGRYEIDMEYSGIGTFDVVLGTDINQLSSFNKVLYTAEKFTEFNKVVSFKVDIPSAGFYYVALHLRAEEASLFGYRLHAFKMKQNLAVPSMVSDLMASVDKTDAPEITLSWTNPDKDNNNAPLSAISRIEVMRDGALLTTLTEGLTPGARSTYLDRLDTPGSHSYSIVVYNENGCFDGTPMSVKSGFAGHPTASFPFAVDFNSCTLAESDMYTILDANADGLTWQLKEEYGSRSFISINRNADGSVTANDYLVSPYIHLTPGYYLLTSYIASHANNFEIGICTNRHNIPATFSSLYTLYDQQANGYQPIKLVIPIDTEGDYCIAWHHLGLPTSYAYATISLKSATLESQALLPSVATNLSTHAETGKMEASISWTNPALDNAGRELHTIARAEIIRNGNLHATVSEGLIPGEQYCFTDTQFDKSGEYDYSVVIYNENGCSEQPAPSKYQFVGFGQTMPYTADFSQWTVLNLGSTYHKWALDTDGTIGFERGMDDSFEYNDGIFSPYLLLENDCRYVVTFHSFGKTSDEQSNFNLCIATRREEAVDVMEISRTGATKRKHTLNLSVSPDATVPTVQADGSVVVPSGNTLIGFYVHQNTAAHIRDFNVTLDETSSIVNLSEENNYELYTLSGTRVSGVPSPGFYIKRQGNTVTKLYLK